MTLIVALACKNGVVMGSDGQATTGSAGGPIRLPTTKIKVIGEDKLWGAAGMVGLIQKVAAAFASIPPELAVASLDNPQLAVNIIQQAHKVRGEELQRHRSLYGANCDDQAGVCDILMVEHKDKPRILHIGVDCSTENLDEFGYGCSGNGDVFAHAFLSLFPTATQCDVDKGALLVYRTIKRAIGVGAFGLGEPIDIWTVTSEGAKQMTPAQMSAIRDALAVWEEVESKMFDRLQMKAD